MAVLVEQLTLGRAGAGWFTGRDPTAAPAPVGRAGNLSHHRPHQPDRLAGDRQRVCAQMGLDPTRLYSMRQVHGAEVGWVTADTPEGAELRGVDALVTTEPSLGLAVAVADCVPLLLAAPGVAAAVHAGRRGLRAGVVEAALDALEELGTRPGRLSAALGPAIGPCCYEVPEPLQHAFLDDHPSAAGTTGWGTPSLDLPGAVEAVLARRGVGDVRRHDACTHCDSGQRWFSHRRNPDAGRQLGVVVLRDPS